MTYSPSDIDKAIERAEHALDRPRSQFASDIRAGDVVLAEQLATGKDTEQKVAHVERKRYVSRTGIIVRFEHGGVAHFNANDRLRTAPRTTHHTTPHAAPRTSNLPS